MMSAFPPPPEAQVTLANWRQSPFNRWGFQHVREIVPSADIANDPDDLWRLPPVQADLSRFEIDDGKGGHSDLDGFLAATATDAFVLVHRGRVVAERYANGMTPATPHILMSVSKSMLGLLAGILVGRGVLDVDAQASRYVPEVTASAFEGATLRQLLDMRSGLDFDEDYLATSGPIIEYRKSTNWNPLGPGELASDLRTFLPTLKQRQRPHGGKFNYVSPCTDLLGWIIERAAGRRYADLMSDLLWKPLGAAHSSYITVDRLGAPRCAGGMCVTATDLARVGQLLVQGGRRGDRQIVPAEWIEDIESAGDAAAWNAGSFVELFPGRAMHYRAKCYVERGPSPLISGLGIHGQHLFVDRQAQIVVAKLSSQVQPLDADGIRMTSRAVDAIRARLTS
ncbi:MAG: serine hydrolase [Hyphomicrobiaceae bacterium]|nr:serine hydrolase [Hyphomicrobiaceae bacterium]